MTLRRRLAAILVTAALVGGGAVSRSDASATAAEPTVTLAAESLSVGGTVHISGAGWVDNARLRVELCGSNGVDGDADCAQAASVVLAPGPDGAVQGVLQITEPPRPCPCIVRITTLDWSRVIDVPVAVAGVPSAPVRSQAPTVSSPQIKIVGANVTSKQTLASLFGYPADRVLDITIQNTGAVPLDEPVVTAAFGKHLGAGQTIDTRGFHPKRLGPGARLSFRIPFRLGSFAMGSYTVTGAIHGGPQRVGFKAKTSTWPWGLFALCLIGAQLVLLAIRDRARRRLAPALQGPGLTTPQPSAAETPVLRSVASVSANVPSPNESGAPRSPRRNGGAPRWRLIEVSSAVAAAVHDFDDVAERFTHNGRAASRIVSVPTQSGMSAESTIPDALTASALAPIDDSWTLDPLAYWALDHRVRGVANERHLAPVRKVS